jgi:ATP-binding cassette, subfamily B, bacterial
MGPHGFAWELAQTHRRIWMSGAAMRVLFRLLPLQVPIVAGWMINALSGVGAQAMPALAETLNRYGAMLAGLALLSGVSAYGSARLQKRMEALMDEELEQRAWERWQAAPPSFRIRFDTDQFSTQILPYCSAAGDLAGKCAMEGLAAGCRMIYPVLMLVWLDPWLALVPLGLLPLQALLAHLATQHGQQHVKAEREARAQTKKLYKQSLSGVQTIQALGAQQMVAAWLKTAQDRFEAIKEDKRKYERVLSSGVWGLAALGLAITWWAGAHRVAAGSLSLGQLVTFAGFVGFLGLPLRSFAGLARKVRNALERLEQVRSFLQIAEEAKQGHKPAGMCEDPRLALRLDQVSYAVAGKPILRQVSVSIARGEFIWIRGRSGSGKSTLLQMMAGLESPGEGVVESGCARAALVGQPVEIFHKSLRANLEVARAGATTGEMIAALRAAGLATTVEGLAQGLESNFGEGLRFSLGERQKLGIARGLLMNAPLLLLDEVTSALDEEAEMELLEELAALKPKTTIVLIANQVRALSGIDRVFELREGTLQEWTTQSRNVHEERK